MQPLEDRQDQRDPVELMATELLDRLRAGEHPTLSEYINRYPEHAEEIRELFPTITAMEKWKVRKRHSTSPAPQWESIQIEQLGEYRILGEIGRGGMGIVYEAEQGTLGRRVAVKVLPRQMLLEQKHLQRFRREARVAARLHHTNIVPVFGVGEQDGLHFYVMQLIVGIGLDKIIQELRHRDHAREESENNEDLSAFTAREAANALCNGEFAFSQRLEPDSLLGADSGVIQEGSDRQAATLTASRIQMHEAIEPEEETSPRETWSFGELDQPYWKSVARLGMQIADALNYAHHQGTVHRDVKPANLLLDARGVVWLTDFGLARGWDQEILSRTGDIAGTLLYVSPEQLEGHPNNQSDIYSLGATLFEMLTLRPAFTEVNQTALMQKILHGTFPKPRSLNRSIPRDLETIVLKAMARDPKLRYATAGEMRDDLERFLDDRPVHARRASALEHFWRWCRRNKAIASLSFAAVALLILVAALTSVGYVQTSRANQQIQSALNAETQQRKRAEAASRVAQRSLEKIFARFDPGGVSVASELTIQGDTGEEVSIPAAPVLSRTDAALLQDLLGYYEELAKQEADNPQIRQKLANAHRRIGDIRHRLGQSAQAIKAYKRAIELYEQLVKEKPADAMTLKNLARACNQLAIVYSSPKQMEERSKALDRSLKLLESVTGAEANNPKVRLELARAHYLYVHRFPFPGGPPPGGRGGGRFPGGRGRRPGRDNSGRVSPASSSDEHHAKAVAILDELVAQYPRVPEYRFLQALCYREVPRSRFFRDPQSLYTSTDKAAKILEQLVKDFPGNPEYRHELIKTYAMHDIRGRFGFRETNSEEAEKRLRTAMSISEKLVMEHPHVPEYATSHVNVLFSLARSLDIREEREEAEKYFRLAVKVQTDLAERYSDVTSYRIWLSVLQDTLARVLMHQKKWTEAKTLLLASISHREKFLKENERERWLRGGIGRSYENLAEVHRELGEDKEAEAALKIWREHDPRHGRDPRGRGGRRGGKDRRDDNERKPDRGRPPD